MHMYCYFRTTISQHHRTVQGPDIFFFWHLAAALISCFDLCISTFSLGMFFPRASIVASEVLTPMIPLLPIGSRQPAALWMLGRVLEALDASLQSLAHRYSCALQDTLPPLPDSLDTLPAAQKAALKMARFSRAQLQQAALARRVGEVLRPYPLLARSFRSDDTYTDIQPFTPPDGASKLMFTATNEESGRLLIKFSPHPYPTEVRFSTILET